MKLIDLYIQEVTRRLPEKMREDIALELRSTIEDMLPRDFSEENVKEVLEKLGNPASLAAEYKDQPMHLIGPKFYDIYKTILKIVLLSAPFAALIAFLIGKIEGIAESETFLLFIISIFGEGLWILISTGIQVFFWVTIIFIILERTISPTVQIPLNWSGKKWSPNDLETITYLPRYKSIKKSETIFGFAWTIVWTVLYFNASRLIGVYESSAGQKGLQYKLPIFENEVLLSYWPIVVFFIIAELLFITYKAVARIWTYKLAVINAILQLAGAIFLVVIISNPNILNPDFTVYMANIFDSPLDAATLMMTRITYGIIFTIIIIGIVDTITGFLKARS